jgi:hypothetical protein
MSAMRKDRVVPSIGGFSGHHDGKVGVTFGEDLHATINQLAARERISFGECVRRLVREGLAARDGKA